VPLGIPPAANDRCARIHHDDVCRARNGPADKGTRRARRYCPNRAAFLKHDRSSGGCVASVCGIDFKGYVDHPGTAPVGSRARGRRPQYASEA